MREPRRTRSVTEGNLGAWLVKADPKGRWDLPAAIEAGLTVVTSWCVVDNYRSAMMKPGDRILLWVSGDGDRLERGIWGLGKVTGRVEDVDREQPEPHDERLWRSEGERRAATTSVPVHIPLLREPVSAAELKAAGITDLEVQRVAQGSNPSWVSKAQLARLEPFLPDWPEAADPELG